MSDRPWIRTIRRETGLIEHICKHGVGHPAIGSVQWMEITTGLASWSVHGCCGCCNEIDWIIEDLAEGSMMANKLLRQANILNAKLLGQRGSEP